VHLTDEITPPPQQGRRIDRLFGRKRLGWGRIERKWFGPSLREQQRGRRVTHFVLRTDLEAVETYTVDTGNGQTLNDPEANHRRQQPMMETASNAGATLVFATNLNPQ